MKPGPKRTAPTKGAPSTGTASVEIEKPIYGGAFLAHAEGKALFVPMTLPSERARVRIVEEKRGYASAEAEEIVNAAPERIVPFCRHFGTCGGCAYQHANYPAQLAYKQAILRETLERGGMHAPDEMRVLSAEPWRYRNRIRLAFDAHENVGYRGRRSHEVVAIRECPIAAPLLVEAGLAAADVARKFPALRPGALALFCDAAESTLLATVHAAGRARSCFENFARAWAERTPALAGVELVMETCAGETPRTLERWGAEWIAYRAAGFDYRVDQGAFFQVNRWLVDALVERVTTGRSGRLAWDLFAGVGLFSHRLAAGFERVVAVESSPAAAASLAHNLGGTTARPIKADALTFLRKNVRGTRPDLIVVDPPRTGLGAPVCAMLAEIAAPALTYVSCDPATLARDLRALLASGYSIETVTLADLFPQTFHLETVIHLRHSRSQQ